MEAKVNFYTQKVRLAINRATEHSLEAIAHRIVSRAQENITANDQIDTGFMRASVYMMSKNESGYDKCDPSGEYPNTGGQTVRRKLAPELSLPGGVGALVAAGAEYAIYQEMRKPFLYKAAEQTAREVGGIIEITARKEIHD